MRPALEVRLAESDPPQPPPQPFGVHRLAAVGSAGQRNLGVAELEAIRGARLDEGQSLQRLDSRARIHGALDVSPRVHAAAAGVDDGDGAAVETFHHVASRDLDENRIGVLCEHLGCG